MISRDKMKNIWNVTFKIIKWSLSIAFCLFALTVFIFYAFVSNEETKEQKNKDPVGSTMDKRFVTYSKTYDGKKSLKLDVINGCLYYDKDGVFQPIVKNEIDKKYDCDMKYVEEYNKK